MFEIEAYPLITVLDGDTLIVDGQWVRIRGIDAAELGPWANCWAEAALGGASRQALLDAVFEREGQWQVVSATPPDAAGMVIADIVTPEGHDLAEWMVIFGHAARTEGRWNWCAPDADLHNPVEGEAPPTGPNLWWPSNRMYDERAAD